MNLLIVKNLNIVNELNLVEFIYFLKLKTFLNTFFNNFIVVTIEWLNFFFFYSFTIFSQYLFDFLPSYHRHSSENMNYIIIIFDFECMYFYYIVLSLPIKG